MEVASQQHSLVQAQAVLPDVSGALQKDKVMLKSYIGHLVFQLEE